MRNRELMTLCFGCENEAASRRLGNSLGRVLNDSYQITLEGNLGAGKTFLVRAIAEGMGLQPRQVSSPTFTIVQEYLPAMLREADTAVTADKGPLHLPLFHFDVYRLPDAKAFVESGLEEYLVRPGVSLIEWAKQVESVLDSDRLAISIELGSCQTGTDTIEMDCVRQQSEEGRMVWVLEEDRRPRCFVFTALGTRTRELLKAWQQTVHFPTDLVVAESGK